MELQPLKIHFYPKLRAKSTDRYSLYMRMVLSGKRVDVSLGYELNKSSWDDRSQSLKVKHPDKAYVLNLMNKYRQQVLDIYQQLIQRGMAYDVNIIRQKLVGYGSTDSTFEPTLLKLFTRVVDRKIALLGVQNSKATIQKYKRCKSHLVNYIKEYYGTSDLKFNHINLQFVEDFELYLKTRGKCCHNTTMKHIQTFKTIYKNALAHGYADKDPFERYKIRIEEVHRTYLSEIELKKLIEFKTPSPKLDNVRDLFVFCCFTGLAFIDLKNLAVKHIQLDNGKYWIRTARQKTKVKSNIPLLDVPMQILNRHVNNLNLLDSEIRIFRVISNQKMNAYLKDLKNLIGIQRDLTFHIARHTFATTVTLNNGVPIESVSSMLGHKHISTTQHYAKLLDKKVGEDMYKLSQKLRDSIDCVARN